ncbi:MAG: carboxymuconolactone decarboxylase family protein [Candidatus Eremiobacteraeota bacterium]|nr:carboxymuconolactone decarboxylase family protein [Candidatus Eremiobacteraeota bacterium]
MDREKGVQVRRQVLGDEHVERGKTEANDFSRHFIDFVEEYCWGNVWIRPGLDLRTRSMLNVAMLAAMARWHEFEVHVRGALNNGVTQDEIAEILLQAGVYAGAPIAAEGFRAARRVIDAYRT